MLLQNILIDYGWEEITHSFEPQIKQRYPKSCAGAWRTFFFPARSTPSVPDAISHMLCMPELFLKMPKFGHGKSQPEPQPAACQGMCTTALLFPKHPHCPSWRGAAAIKFLQLTGGNTAMTDSCIPGHDLEPSSAEQKEPSDSFFQQGVFDNRFLTWGKPGVVEAPAPCKSSPGWGKGGLAE